MNDKPLARRTWMGETALSWCKLNRIPDEVMSKMLHKVLTTSRMLLKGSKESWMFGLEIFAKLGIRIPSGLRGETLALLRATLQDRRYSGFRPQLVQYLGLFGKEASSDRKSEVLALLNETLEDQFGVDSRCMTIATLRELGQEVSQERWQGALTSVKEHSFANARDLSKLGQKSPPERFREVFTVLKEALHHKKERVRFDALLSLNLMELGEDISSERWEEVFVEAKNVLLLEPDQVWYNQNLAAHTLVSLLGKEVLPERWREVFEVLKEGFERGIHPGGDSNGYDSSIAVALAHMCQEGSQEQWEAIFELFKKGLQKDFWLEKKVTEDDLRASIIYALGILGKKTSPERWEKVFTEIKGALEDKDGDIRRTALQSIRHLGEELYLERWEKVFAEIKRVLEGKDKGKAGSAKSVSFSGNLAAATQSLAFIVNDKVPQERWLDILAVLKNALPNLQVPVWREPGASLIRLIKRVSSDRCIDVLEIAKSLGVTMNVIESFIDHFGKKHKPLCIHALNPASPPKLYDGQRQDSGKPLSQEFIQMMRQAVIKTPFGKYLKSYTT